MVTEKQRLPRLIREDAPCRYCTERFPACSGCCPKDARGEFGYKAWKEAIQKIKDNRKAYNNLNRKKTWIIK